MTGVCALTREGSEDKNNNKKDDCRFHTQKERLFRDKKEKEARCDVARAFLSCCFCWRFVCAFLSLWVGVGGVKKMKCARLGI